MPLTSTIASMYARSKAAPFSFFNAFSNVPPLLVIGIEGNGRKDGKPYKDTARNIIAISGPVPGPTDGLVVVNGSKPFKAAADKK